MEKACVITNRSAGIVSYSIPEDNVHRIFQAGESKRVSLSEIEKLAYQPGGNLLIAEYLQIKDQDIINGYGFKPEPEYYMSEADIIDLIKNGSLDAWLDCLDFAPAGVLDLVKKLSISVPLSDYEKRKALSEKLKFDVDAAIKYEEEKRAESGASTQPKTRRTQTTETATAEEAPARRTTVKYNVNKKG